MTQAALPPARSFNGGLRLPISDNKILLLTSIDIEKELWSILEYYSEVEEAGIDLIRTKGLPQSLHQEIYRYLQAFVRQAKSYYSSAKTLHYRSSSLLYYYSFLNLAKAYLLLKDPNSMMNPTARQIHHGLSYSPSNNNLDFILETVKVYKGIFPSLYEAQTGYTILTAPNRALNIVQLLSYCSDMAYQYSSAGYGSPKLLHSLSGLLISSLELNESWSIIGIPAVNDLDAFLNVHGNFLTDYQEVKIEVYQLTSLFQKSGPELIKYRFFQDITPVTIIDSLIRGNVHITKVRNALTPYLSVHYFEDNIDFDLALPYEDASTTIPIPMTEALAIYVVMFYLSSLVRYRPAYLESLLSFKPSWLIESFVNTTPETFLRIMICKIVGKDFVLRRR